jgi:hypothetical protein
MEASSAHCRAQEARQRELADNAILDNVRAIATTAANAWHREALSADRREARRESARQLAEQRSLEAAAAAVQHALEDHISDSDSDSDGQQWSEYPDTGLATNLDRSDHS